MNGKQQIRVAKCILVGFALVVGLFLLSEKSHSDQEKARGDTHSTEKIKVSDRVLPPQDRGRSSVGLITDQNQERVEPQRLSQEERNKLVVQFTERFKVLVYADETARSLLVENKENAAGSVTTYVVRKATDIERSEVLKNLEVLVEESPDSLRGEVRASLQGALDFRDHLYAGDAPFQMIRFSIPTDPTRVPHVKEMGVQGADPESLRHSTYGRIGSNVRDYPHFIQIEVEGGN